MNLPWEKMQIKKNKSLAFGNYNTYKSGGDWTTKETEKEEPVM